VKAAAAPELHPITARSFPWRDSVTPACVSTAGSTSASMNSANLPDIVSYSRPRCEPCASPPPFWIMTATIAGTRFCAMRLSRMRGNTVSGSPSLGPSCVTMNDAAVPFLY
jgi:hypothetical protein